ncbi:Cystathionine beta-lyase [compost metagenome]
MFHPALPDHPDHALWRRDFTGSNGLLSFELNETDTVYIERFIDALQLFGLGASWGGFESLITVADTQDRNSAADRSLYPVLRLHIGLEDVAALIEDLQHGFRALG